MKIGPGASSGGGMAQAILGGRELAQQRRHGKRQQRMAGAQLGLGIGKAVADLGVSITHLIQQAQRNAIYESEQKDRERHNKWVEAGGLKMPEDMPKDVQWQGPPPEVPIDVYQARSGRIAAENRDKQPDPVKQVMVRMALDEAAKKTPMLSPDRREGYLREIELGTPGPMSKEVDALGRVMSALRANKEDIGETGLLPQTYFTSPAEGRPAQIAGLLQKVRGLGLPQEDFRAAAEHVRANMGNVDLGPYLEGIERKIGTWKGYKQPSVLLAPPDGIYGGPGSRPPGLSGIHTLQEGKRRLMEQFPTVPSIPWSGQPPYPQPTMDDLAQAQALREAFFPQGVLQPPPAQSSVGGNPMTFPFRGLLDSFRQKPIPPQGQR